MYKIKSIILIALVLLMSCNRKDEPMQDKDNYQCQTIPLPTGQVQKEEA